MRYNLSRDDTETDRMTSHLQRRFRDMNILGCILRGFRDLFSIENKRFLEKLSLAPFLSLATPHKVIRRCDQRLLDNLPTLCEGFQGSWKDCRCGSFDEADTSIRICQQQDRLTQSNNSQSVLVYVVPQELHVCHKVEVRRTARVVVRQLRRAHMLDPQFLPSVFEPLEVGFAPGLLPEVTDALPDGVTRDGGEDLFQGGPVEAFAGATANSDNSRSVPSKIIHVFCPLEAVATVYDLLRLD